jgi:glycosyltransferase involved in cell wall biosynthesis
MQGSIESVPLVSVVIPTLNVERYIGQCIQAVLNNKYSNLEIIVVDNGSKDATCQIAKELGTKIHSLPGATISALRNYGVKESEGSIIAFLDSDCIAAVDWINQGLKALSEEKAIVGYLYDVPSNAGWMEQDWFCQRDIGRQEAVSLGGGNIFVTKEVFNKVGGFDENLTTGEDTEFCSRVRRIAKVISDDRVRVTHLGNPKTIKQFVKREIWYGLGAFGSFKVEKYDKPLLGTLAFLGMLLSLLMGTLILLLGYGAELLALSLLMLIGLIGATLFYRRRHIHSPEHALRLGFLYVLFYLGRSVSLVYLLADKTYYHNIKK